jgi:hypothetical protein
LQACTTTLLWRHFDEILAFRHFKLFYCQLLRAQT